jgi:hypothetical protein
MIGVIRIRLKNKAYSHTELTSLLKKVFPHAVALTARNARGIHQYAPKNLIDSAVCSCDAPGGSVAMGLWYDQHRFELVVETQKHGNLRKALEEIVGAVLVIAKAESAELDLAVEIRSLSDGKHYLEGEPWGLLSSVWRNSKEQVYLLMISVLLIPLVPHLFPSYKEEAFAVLVGVGLGLGLRVVVALGSRPGIIDWRLV